MSERRENSVLFSLKELRRIEDDRVKQEDDEKKAKEDAELAAKQAAERKAREDAERIKRDEEERIRAIEDAKQNKLREEQLRLQESEQRARIDAQAKIEAERVKAELIAKAHGKSVAKPVFAVVVVLLAVGGGLGYKILQDHAAEKARLVAEKQAAAEEAKRTEAELNAKFAAIQKEMEEKLNKATSAEERAAILAAAEAEKKAASDARVQHHRPRGGGGGGGETKKAPEAPSTGGPAITPKVRKKEVSDNPLDGLQL